MNASSRQDSDAEEEGPDNGCGPVNWTGDSSNDQRLLDLIDLMDPSVKESVLMTPPGMRTSPTRTQCCIELAVKFFTIQPHERFRKGDIIRLRIKEYSRKYAEVLRNIGPKASRMKFEEFPATGEIHTKIVDALERFPAWKRLHVFWRTSPHFNPYFIENRNSSTQSSPARSLAAIPGRQSSPGRRQRYANRTMRRKCRDDHREHEVIDVDDLEDGHTELIQNVKGTLPKSRNRSTTTRVGNISRGMKRSRLSFETDSDQLDVDKDQLTPSQKLKHDRQMAELRLEEAKVELEKQKVAAEMQMRKQEFKLRMIEARGSKEKK